MRIGDRLDRVEAFLSTRPRALWWLAGGLLVVAFIAAIATGQAPERAFGRLASIVIGLAVGVGVPQLIIWLSTAFGEADEAIAAKASGFDLTRTANADVETLQAGASALERLLDSTTTRVERVERLATFIPAGLGLIGTFAIGRLAPDIEGLTAPLGTAAVGAGLVSVMGSTLTIVRHRPDTPHTYGALYATHLPYDSFMQGYIEELVRSIERARFALGSKRAHLGQAYIGAAAAVFFLYLFGLLGGFAPVTGA